MRQDWVLGLGVLSACVQTDPESMGGIIETTDDMSIADTGFPFTAVMSHRLATQADGTTLSAVQFDAALATPDMIAAAPAALCAGVELSLVSSREVAPTLDDLDIAGSRVIEAICK